MRLEFGSPSLLENSIQDICLNWNVFIFSASFLHIMVEGLCLSFYSFYFEHQSLSLNQ